jgi:hypothetical protein
MPVERMSQPVGLGGKSLCSRNFTLPGSQEKRDDDGSIAGGTRSLNVCLPDRLLYRQARGGD